MNDRELLALAAVTLNDDEFRVWFTKHYHQLGRRKGSLHLGITEDQWRYHERNAQAKMTTAIQENAA